jgi:peptide/nickel transport system substrate-binding protein
MTVAYVGPCCVGVDNNNPFGQGADYEWTHLYLEHLLTASVIPNAVNKNPFSGVYGPLMPELADSWSVSTDHMTWTFKLHPGIKWDDGTPFTADDVEYSFDLCLNSNIGVPCYPSSGMHGIVGAQDVVSGKATSISGINVVDPLTLTITTTSPDALIPDEVQYLFIIQKASVSAIPVDQIGKSQYWNTPNDANGKGGVQGTGPFIVDAYSAGQSMEVRRNDTYWRSKPFLDKIVRREFKDTATALLAFEAGQVDMTFVEAADVPKEQSSTVGTLLPGNSGHDEAIALNPVMIKDFGDKRVRQAFLYAIDRVSILKNIYGYSDPVPALTCLYQNPAQIPSDAATYNYDPAKAKQLLAAAGADPSKWGTIVFDTYFQDSVSLAAMQAIQANLADVGIKVTIQQMDAASWVDRFYGKGTAPGQAVMSLEGSGNGSASTGYGYSTLHSAAAYPTGNNGWNGFYWSFPEMDKSLDAIRTDFDPAQRLTDIQNVCRLDADLQPYLNMWYIGWDWIVSNRIGNFIGAPGPQSYYKAAEMWYIK